MLINKLHFFFLRYLVGINAVTAAYAVASLLLPSFKSFARYDWLILVLDQVRVLHPNIFSILYFSLLDCLLRLPILGTCCAN